MKHSTLLVILLLSLISCSNHSAIIEPQTTNIQTVLTKENQLKELYKNKVIPMFLTYTNVEIPTEFQIDKLDLGINAGASFGYVEVSLGLVNLPQEHLQLFALCHEVAHIVTIKQAERYNLSNKIPEGSINAYKKAEFLADLITIDLIKQKETEWYLKITEDYNTLQSMLGAETFTHPSGADRINFIKNYIAHCQEQNSQKVLENLFKKIWLL